MDILYKKIECIRNISPNIIFLLKKLDIYIYKDILEFIPIKYIDKSIIHKINDIYNNKYNFVNIIGKITSCSYNKKYNIFSLSIMDDTGIAILNWFKIKKWQIDKLKLYIGKKVMVYGSYNIFNSNIVLCHPDINIYKNINKENLTYIIPIYNISDKYKKIGLTNDSFIKIVKNVIHEVSKYNIENIPYYIVNKNNLLSKLDSYSNIHFPKSLNCVEKCIYRLKFEELFFFNLNNFILKHNLKKNISRPFNNIGPNFDFFYKNILPFELTQSQKNVIKEIRKDLSKKYAMNRILQGDVGSGKTIVAIICMLICLDNNLSCIFMVPTEVLAIQHFNYINQTLFDLKLNIKLLTRSTIKKDRENIIKNLTEGNINILIGTHSLLNNEIVFNNVGLIIIDEQHKFGVRQRYNLVKKSNISPHLLIMSATPIPRTLAMCFMGNIDISTIQDMPLGRKPIITIHKTDSQRLSVFNFMKKIILSGRQVYVIYPLIEESKNSSLKYLLDGYDSLSREFPLPDFAISIVHGRQKITEKNYEINRFKKGETQILVSTTVIEVGIDIPNASLIIIENAERFGLSQLHQLRGRVGRAQFQSYCILLTKDNISDISLKRMNIMCTNNSGFKISEEDLKIRGPGSIMGTKQSGSIKFKFSDIYNDKYILDKTMYFANYIIKHDPKLIHKYHLNLRLYLKKELKNKFFWSKIS